MKSILRSRTSILIAIMMCSFGFQVMGQYDVSEATYLGDDERFSISAQDAFPFGLAFNNDGTKMFLLGDIGNDINEYHLTTPYDVSTATYAGDAERFVFETEETLAWAMAFKPDGTKMFLAGPGSHTIYEYDLSVAFDVSTAAYAGDAEKFDLTNQVSQAASIVFNNDGTKMFVLDVSTRMVSEYTLSAYDVSTAVYAGDAERFSILNEDNSPFAILFNPSGTKLFMLGATGKDVNQYSLSVAFDVSTATYDGDAERVDVSGQETTPRAMTFNNDGTKLYLVGNGEKKIIEYTLVNIPAVISGTVADQPIGETQTTTPFSAVTITDLEGDNVSATITLDDNAKGALSGTKLTGSGPYQLASTSIPDLQAQLRALVFDPTDNRVSSGSETTVLTLTINDGTDNTSDNTTTVVSSPIAPFVRSIGVVGTPASSATSVDFLVTFSENVTGVDLSDFTLDKSAFVSGNLSAIVGSDKSYTVTVDGISGDGTISIDLKDSGTDIVDLGGSAIDGGFVLGARHDIGVAFDISKAAFTGNLERYPVGDHDHFPASMAFNLDGTKLFMIGISDKFVKQYELSTAYDISTAIHSGEAKALMVAAQDGAPQGFEFNNDGTKLFVVGDNTDAIHEYSLSTAFDLTTATYNGDAQKLSVAAQDQSPRGIAFSLDGLKLFVSGWEGDDINEYQLTVPFDISTASYSGDAERLSIASEEEFAFDFTFNSNGTKLFVIGSDSDAINQYDLSIPFDISTAVYAGAGQAFSVKSEETVPASILFSHDGTKFFVGGRIGLDINEYSLMPFVKSIEVSGTPASSATTLDFEVKFSQDVTGVDLGDFSLDASAGVNGSISTISGSGSTYTVTVDGVSGLGLLSIDLKSSGTGISANSGVVVNGGYTAGESHQVGSAFDVSGGFYTGFLESLYVADRDAQPTAIRFSEDGTKLFLLGIDSDEILAFNLSTAFDISTAQYAGDSKKFSIANQEVDASDIAFNKKGTLMHVLGNTSGMITEYRLSTPWDVSTADYNGNNNRFSVATQDANPTGLTFSEDGFKMFMVGTVGDNVYEYDLSVPFDVSSAVYAGNAEYLYIGGEEGTPFSIDFSHDGKTLFVLGSEADAIKQYTLSSAFDVSTGTYAGNSKDLGVSNEDDTPVSLAFSHDGSRLMVLGASQKKVFEYSLVPLVKSIAVSGSPTSDAVSVDFTVTFSEAVNGVELGDFQLNASSKVFGELTTISGTGPTYTVSVGSIAGDGVLKLDLKSSGTNIASVSGASLQGGFEAGEWHRVGGAYDVSEAVYAGDAERFLVNAQDVNPFAVQFNADGSKMFVMGSQKDKVSEYNLSTAFDVSTAVFAGDSEQFYVGGEEPTPYSLSFSSNGLKMFVLGLSKKKVIQYELTSPYDVSTAVYQGAATDLPISGIESFPTALTFNRDGSKMFAMGTSLDKVLEYDLSVPFNSATATYAGDAEGFEIGAQENLPYAITFDKSGKKMFVVGIGTDRIYEYDLTTAFDVSTAVFSGLGERFFVGNQEPKPTAMTFSADGTKLFVTGIDRSYVVEYDMSSNVAPSISGTQGGQAINDEQTVNPFAGVTLADANNNNVSMTITLDDNAKGTLTGTGLNGTDPYTISRGSLSAVQSTLQGLTFTPSKNRVANGNETTTFEIVMSDGLLSSSDNVTQVETSPVAPMVNSISISGTPMANSTQIDFQIEFNEAVTGVGVEDFDLDASGVSASINSLSGSGNSYVLNVNNITGAGSLSVDLKAAGTGIQDAGAAEVTAGFTTGATHTVDLIAPGVVNITRQNPTSQKTNADVLVWDVSFSEAIQDLDISDFELIGTTGIIESVTDLGGNAYRVQSSGGDLSSFNGTVTISFASAQNIKDAAGNALTNTVPSGTNENAYELDNAAPSISINAIAGDNVINETEDDTALSISGSTSGAEDGQQLSIEINGKSYATQVSSDAWSLTVPETDVQAFDASEVVKANVADQVGNQAVQQEQTIAYDAVAPDVTVSSATSGLTSGPFEIDITFTEEVSGFELSDIETVNATASEFSGSGLAYKAKITPNADGLVSVSIAAGKAQDAAGNGNLASNLFEITNDESALIVTISSSAGNIVSGAFDVSIQFSAEVTDFEVSDVTVVNGIAGALTGSGKDYTVNITPGSDGNVSVMVPANVATNAFAVKNNESNTFSTVNDETAPQVTLSSLVSDATNAAFAISIDFSETVSGFDVSDITVVNGAVNDLSGSGTNYTATVMPSTDGEVSVSIASGVSNDQAGNVNTASNGLSTVYDQTRPGVEISSTVSGSTNGQFTSNITFSESVTGFDLGDISVVNATVTSLSGSNDAYEAVITPDMQGAVSIDVGADVAQDIAGNTNTASDQFSIDIVANHAPTDITLSSAVIAENNAIGAQIGEFGTSDQNPEDQHDYSLISGDGSDDNASFEISNGVLTALEQFDFETKNSYSIRVEVDDNKGGRFEKQFEIQITNVEEPVMELEGQLSFDPTAVGTSASQSFVIRNLGDGPLMVSTVTLPQGFSSDWTSGSILPSESQTVTVTFSPDEAKVYSGNIEVESNAGMSSISASGEGQVITSTDDQVIQEVNVKAFPNPASDQIQIDLSRFSQKVDQIELYNLSGQSVYTKENFQASELTISVNGYDPGMYLLIVKSGNAIGKKKVIIKR